MPRVIKVIETEQEKRGSGTPKDPYRRIVQYFTLDGELLAENDCQLGIQLQQNQELIETLQDKISYLANELDIARSTKPESEGK